jgi:Protein of unknown function (DUF2795)
MIERGSDKHGPRLDEAMEQEVEGLVRGGGPTHAEEWKQPEPAGEDQPAGGIEGGREGAAPPGMSEDEVELRSELATRLNRAPFPTDASGLLDRLVEEDAPDRLLELVRRLPPGRAYESVGEVWDALGLGHEQHRF